MHWGRPPPSGGSRLRKGGTWLKIHQSPPKRFRDYLRYGSTVAPVIRDGCLMFPRSVPHSRNPLEGPLGPPQNLRLLSRWFSSGVQPGPEGFPSSGGTLRQHPTPPSQRSSPLIMKSLNCRRSHPHQLFQLPSQYRTYLRIPQIVHLLMPSVSAVSPPFPGLPIRIGRHPSLIPITNIPSKMTPHSSC